MEKIITVQEAAIKTTTVEVKHLLVSNRKLTMGVFRQIPEEKLMVIGDKEFRGIPWGIVNYYWKDLKTSHLHIVWQKDDVLKRCLLNPLFRKDVYKGLVEEDYIIKERVDISVNDDNSLRVSLNDEEYWNVRNLINDYGDTDQLDLIPLTVTLEEIPDIDRGYNLPQREREQHVKLQEEKIRPIEKRNELTTANFTNQVECIIVQLAKDAYEEYRVSINRYNELLSEVKKLDQLFIAV